MAYRKAPAIGIDLGTWKCCVGVLREGKLEIIENERGSKTTPSYVAFTETERLMGEDAKDQVALNPTNTVFGVKRIIGRRFDDSDLKHHLVNFPFKTREQCGPGGIEILVQYKGTEKWLPPEHITAMLLRKIKLTAEAYLGCPVQEAVVSVPACFNSGQRQATLDAAEIAGLKVLQLLHEPTAVALAFKDQAGSGALNQTVMVVDAGGGTMEISIASIKENEVKVLATSSDDHLGGLDLDQLLVNECVKRFQFGRQCDLSKNRKAMERLRLACQKAKDSLTLLRDTVIFVDCFADRKDLKIPISREQFTQLFSERVHEGLNKILKDALQGAKLSLSNIDEVIVVGGTARVPSILNKLQEMLPDKKLIKSVNVDEAVAYGAALQAALLAGDNTVKDTRIFDVIPRDFVLENTHYWISKTTGVVFHRNSSFPSSSDWDVPIGTDGEQTWNLFEREGKKNSNNSHIGPINTYIFQFKSSLNPWRKVPVLFFIDKNCLLSAPPRPAVQHSQMKVHQISSLDTSLTTSKEEEQSFQRDELDKHERIQAISKLESSCFEMKAVVKGWKTENEGQKPAKDFCRKCESVLKACDDTVGWIDSEPSTGIVQLTEWQMQLDQRMNSLVDLLSNTPQFGEDMVNVPCARSSISSQSPREILQDNHSRHSGVTATLSDKSLRTDLVKEHKLLKTNSNCTSSGIKIETSISSNKLVGKVYLPSMSSSVSSHNSESNLNSAMDVAKTKLNTNKTNTSNERNACTDEQELFHQTEINSANSATCLEDTFRQKVSIGSSPPAAEITELQVNCEEMATNMTYSARLYNRTSNLANPVRAMSDSCVSPEVSGATLALIRESDMSGSDDLSEVTAKTRGNANFIEELVCIRIELEDCQSRIQKTHEYFAPRQEVIEIEDDAGVFGSEEHLEQHQPRPAEKTCTDDDIVDSAQKNEGVKPRAGCEQGLYTNVSSNRRRSSVSVAERLKKQGNKGKSTTSTEGSDITTHVMDNSYIDRTADSKPLNSVNTSNTGGTTYLDGNGDMPTAAMSTESSIDSSENVNDSKEIASTSGLNINAAWFTPECLKMKESKQSTRDNIFEVALQTGQNDKQTTQSHNKLVPVQNQQHEVQFQQLEAQPQQQDAKPQQQDAQSQQQNAQSQQQNARSQQQDAQSQQLDAQSQQQDAQSQKQDAQSQQQDVQSQQQDAHTQQQNAHTQQQNTQSQQQDAQSQQQDSQSQQQVAPFQQQEAQISKHCYNQPGVNAFILPVNTSQKNPERSEPNPPERNGRVGAEQNNIPPEACKRPAQHQGRPEAENKRPEPHHSLPDQLQQPSGPHVTSQQNAVSTHERKSPAIGIDLGTWKCCVGVVREGKVEIIENERGSKTTPSYVAFTETERLVGEDAKDQVALNPTNTVFGVKRIIGRRFDDYSIQTDMEFWPFTVSPDEYERPRISVRYLKEEKVLRSELVSAMMLEKMKRIAESQLGCEVRDAVISVPAYFNNSQRQATKDAGAIAGLNVLGLINEPTAAALAYRDNKARVEPHNVLIFDLGGGTFDVAVIRVDESGVKVKGVFGDAEFGGNEMDVLLMKHFEGEFVKKHGKPVLQDKKALERLRTASEKAKKTLTLLPKANVQIDSLIEDSDFNASITRQDFEQLFYKGAKEIIDVVLTNVLQQANILLSDVNEVVLVGGSSRIPKIQSILKEFFGGKALNKTVNLDEAVAHGAALQAALLADDNEVKEVFVAELVQDPATNHPVGPTAAYGSSTTPSSKYLNRSSLVECLTATEITQLAAQLRQFVLDDQELKEGEVAMSDLEAFCFNAKALATRNSSLRQKLGQDELKEIADRCEEMICWLDDNDSATKTACQRKKSELFGRISVVMMKGNVKIEDFDGTDQEWFREILLVGSEKPSCGVRTVASHEHLDKTLTLPQHELNNLAQSTPTLPQHVESNSSQPTTTPPQQVQSNSCHSKSTPPQQVQSNSSQSTPTPSQQVQSNSSHSTPTPPQQVQSISSLSAAHQEQLRCSREITLQKQARSPKSPSLHRVEDPHLKTEGDIKHKNASESDGTRHSSKQNQGETEEKMSRPKKIVPIYTRFDNQPILKGDHTTSPRDPSSHLSPCQLNLTSNSANSFTPDNHTDTNYRINPRSPDSGICSPTVEKESPATEVRVENLIGFEFTSWGRSDSGNASPQSPSSITGDSSESSATSLSDGSKGKPVTIMDTSHKRFNGGHSQISVILQKNLDSVAAAQNKLHCRSFNDLYHNSVTEVSRCKQESESLKVQLSAHPCREDKVEQSIDDIIATGRGEVGDIAATGGEEGGDITVTGRVEGDITATGRGEVGDIAATGGEEGGDITVAGRVEGDITATGRGEVGDIAATGREEGGDITVTGRVEGDITATGRGEVGDIAATDREEGGDITVTGRVESDIAVPDRGEVCDIAATDRQERIIDHEVITAHKDATAIADNMHLAHGGSTQPASIEFVNETKTAARSPSQDVDTLVKSLLRSPIQPCEGSYNDVVPVHKRRPEHAMIYKNQSALLFTRDDQSLWSAVPCLRVTPAAIYSDPDVDLSANSKMHLDKIGGSRSSETLRSTRMKLPNTSMSPGTVSFDMAFSDHLRNYYNPFNYSNSTNSPQQPCATKGVRHSADHGPAVPNNRDPCAVSQSQPALNSIEHVKAHLPEQTWNHSDQRQLRPASMDHDIPEVHQQQRSCEGVQGYTSVCMDQGVQRSNYGDSNEPLAAHQKGSPA